MEQLKALVKNWIRKTKNDLKTRKDELKNGEPATDTLGFYAQQCVEKYLKTYLVFNQKHFGKIHNIAKLFELCKEKEKEEFIR